MRLQAGFEVGSKADHIEVREFVVVFFQDGCRSNQGVAQKIPRAL